MSGMWSPMQQDFCGRLILFNVIFNITSKVFFFFLELFKKKTKVVPMTWVLRVLL